ncbi:hypothetical protein N9N28_12775 [Rubripirellula amarantea]|uniref:Tetratricopeptide repeat protein n=1 Tax=Rubripirellula amarantea TaxID=2527999 RepID=A0A5C5WPP5_9BACT|nr:hypothetical protein [Rubripirellula amarantea]MDA8745499.1 hypothetical protein [Rubripirellula amarantea]TWT52537.1 hypothetical protein Pla22_01610 [Rubripirellula amarantea]
MSAIDPPETKVSVDKLDPKESFNGDRKTETHAGKPGHWQTVRVSDLKRKHVDPEAEPEQKKTPAEPDRKVALHRRQELEHHLKSNPTDLSSFLELARIYRAEHKPIEAKRVLQQAIQIFPDDASLVWELEEAILARSLQQLREVSDLASRLDTAETDRELKRCQQDWARQRIEVCRARLRREPSHVHLRLALGEALHDAGMYENSIEELESVLQDDEHSPAAYLIQGKCLLAMKKELDAMVKLRACALRRSVIAPVRTRVLALKLLCETAERLGITLTAKRYRQQLIIAEEELAKLTPVNS